MKRTTWILGGRLRPAALGAAVLSSILALAQTGTAQAPARDQYRVQTLLTNLSNPVQIAFRPDGRLYLIQKSGVITLYNPADSSSVTAATLAVVSTSLGGPESGLQSIALDPGFATNNRVYLLYNASAGDSVLVLARFTAQASGLIDTSTRVQMLRIPQNFQSNAEHPTGCLSFDKDGNLFVSVADNTKNYTSGANNAAGYSPRNPADRVYDAQRSAANTNDLRGKILRIRPQDNGTYTIPAGNLFTPGRDSTRPEIYVMGLRHPYRITTDPVTGWLYWGEPGPNASADNATLGPRGYDEVNLAKSPGNYGWPYCAGNNACYNAHDYQTNASGAVYKPDSLVNLSPNNTGIRRLPPARPSQIWYSYRNSTPAETTFSIFGTGSNLATAPVSLAGPVYSFNAGLASSVKFPQYYDRTLFLLDFQRSLVHAARIGDSGQFVSIERFWDLTGNSALTGPMDLKVGPDGSFYFVAWGSNTYAATSGSGRLVRLQYTGLPTGLAPGARPRPLGANGALVVFEPGSRFEIPAGSRSAEFYTIGGAKLWSFHREVTSAPAWITPPSPVRGVVRVKLSSR